MYYYYYYDKRTLEIYKCKYVFEGICYACVSTNMIFSRC